MKVFRKELYYKATGKTEEFVKSHKITWPMECDGKEVVKSAFRYEILGTDYGADETWLEEVCDITREEDREQMKSWKIGTEHVIRINGKDKRVVVESSYDEKAFTCRTHCALYQFIKDIGCCDAHKCVSYARPDLEGVYYKEVKVHVHKPLVLNLFFSPERNMTFTEHDINPEVGFVTGKYYRFIGKKAIGLMHLTDMLKVLDNKVHKCTNGNGRSANFEGIGDAVNSIMFTWIHQGSESEEFKYWKEMRPLVVMQAPDIITFDELCTFNGGSITGELPSSFSGLFDALTGRERVEPNIKEITKMKVDKHFAFKKKFFGTTLHEPKVVKTHKSYANDGACEACGATINSGDFVLTANETDCNRVTKKTHRLCASCTAKYIKAKSDTDEKHSYIEGFKDFVKTNDIKVGTRIRITKDFGKDEDAGTYGHKGAEGRCGTVYYVGHKYINVRMDGEKGWWSVPYYVMEVIKETAKEPTYAERHTQWIKDNNIKEGTKVRVTRTFETGENGCKVQYFPVKGHFIGDDCVVWRVCSDCIDVRSKQKDDWWSFPYFVLEVVPEEPWFKIGDKVRITIKSSDAYNKIGTVTDVHMHKDGTQTVYMNFAEFCGTRAFNADKPEKIGELYVPSYKELQDAWIAKHNLKEGDKVVILRTAEARENGWPNSWCGTMTMKVGQMHTVEEAKETGIDLSCGFRWPYFVLGVVKE